MRVGFDIRPLVRQKTGVGRYLLGLLPSLLARRVGVVALSASLRDRVDPTLLPGVELYDRRISVRLLDWAWNRLRAPAFEQLANAVDVTHSATPFPLPSRSAASFVTVHDLFFLSQPDDVALDIARHWASRVRTAVHEADAVICVSRATADETVARLEIAPERLHVIHHGLEPYWFEASDQQRERAAARDIAGGRPFLLAVGALEKRKNYPRLLSAFDRLRRGGARDLQLVIVGPPGTDDQAIQTTHRGLGLGDSLILAGYQDDLRLRALYRTAVALVIPSIDEGFGFPVVEAMASGCPVVAADRGALPEVGGDAAHYFDPFDEEAIVEAVLPVVEDAKLRAALASAGRERARRFDWSVTAAQTLAAYDDAVRVREARGTDD